MAAWSRDAASLSPVILVGLSSIRQRRGVLRILDDEGRESTDEVPGGTEGTTLGEETTTGGARSDGEAGAGIEGCFSASYGVASTRREPTWRGGRW